MTQERILAGFALYHPVMNREALTEVVQRLVEEATADGMRDHDIIETLESVMRDVIQRQGR